MRAEVTRDSSLAGLGYSFSPLQLPQPCRDKQGRAESGEEAKAPARPRNAAAASVRFNLRDRQPGARYGSPLGDDARQQQEDPAGKQQQQQQQQQQRTTAAGLARLKLASLARRRTGQLQEAAFEPSPEPVLPRLQSENVDCSLPCNGAAQQQRLQQGLMDAAGWALAGRDATAKLPCQEMPGGCSEATAKDNLLQRADSNVEGDCIAAYHSKPEVPAVEHGQQQEQQQQELSCPEMSHEPTIQRVHALLDSICLPTAVSEQLAGPESSGQQLALEPVASAVLVAQQQQHMEPPASLEEALRLLGLVPPHEADCCEPSSACATAPSSSSLQQQQQQQQHKQLPLRPFMAPPRVKLAAVTVVLAAKQAAHRQELVQLLLRLGQTRMHLAFHQANLQRGRSPAKASPPPGSEPWLPGRASSADSKHRRASPAGRQLPPRPRVARPSQEASQLQVRLLGTLQAKLRLKLGLAALRQAAVLGRLRRQLLSALAGSERCRLAAISLAGWRVVAMPSPAQVQAADALHLRWLRRRQQHQLREWQRWAARRAWQRWQAARGLAAYHRSLLAAALRHWQAYCQGRHLKRLRRALASRWLAAWTARRALTAWRQAAQRSAQLKRALLGGGASAGRRAPARMPPPTLPQALAAARAGFQPVKSFVGEAAAQLRALQSSLRFATAGACEGSMQLLQQQPALGSLESLLVLAAPPRATQQEPLLLCGPGAVDTHNTASPPPAAALEPLADRPEAPETGSPAAAPDPGSPAYNPAQYTSPARLVPGDATAAVEAELLDCQQAVAALAHELAALEEESVSLQQDLSGGEARVAAAQGEAARLACEAVAAARARDASAAAMQSAAEGQAAAGAECVRMTRLVSQCEVGAREAAAAAASARAAAQSASEVHALASAAVQKWRSKVEAVARELSACHRSQQPAVAARLREARQRLEQHQQQADAAAGTLPALQAEARAAEQAAGQAQETLAAMNEQLVEKAEQLARVQQRMAAATERHEQAAVAAVAAEQAADAAAQEQRLLSSQQQLRAGRLRQLAHQVLHRQQAVRAMQQQVGALQQAHQRVVSAAGAAGKLKRRALDVRLAAVAGRDAATAGSPAPRLPLRPAEEQQQPEAEGNWWEQSLLHGMHQSQQQPRPQQRPPLSPPQQASPGSLQTSDEPSASGGSVEEQQDPGCEPCGALVLAAQTSDWSCLSSALPSPRPAPMAPHSLCSAADLFFRRSRLRHAFALLRSQAQRARLLLAEAADWHARRCLVACFREWRRETEKQAAWLARASLALRRSSVLRQWAAAAQLRAWLHEAEAAAGLHRRRVLLRAGLVALRQRVEHQRWRDKVHEAVVLLRLRNTLCAWRAWARLHRMEGARCHRALALHHAHVLRAAWRHWRWYAHGRALLGRVFGTAVEFWREECGAALHANNFISLRAAFDAWQLATLAAQEERRQAMLAHAADAHRERWLLAAGLAGFVQAAADAREAARVRRLQRRMFAEWRSLVAGSQRHWEYEAARHQRKRALLRLAFAAWRGAEEETSGLLARFWLRWQVHALLRRALLGWRAAASVIRQRGQAQALAATQARVSLERRALGAWQQGATQQREQRVAEGMAEVHHERRLLAAGMAALRSNAAQSGDSEEVAAALAVAGSGGEQRRSRTTSTMVVMHRRTLQPRQKQQEQHPGSSSTTHPQPAACLTSDLLQAMEAWQQQAEHWRQRQQAYVAAAPCPQP